MSSKQTEKKHSNGDGQNNIIWMHLRRKRRSDGEREGNRKQRERNKR